MAVAALTVFSAAPGRTATAVADTIVLSHATVLPMSRDTVLRDRAVVVSDGRIVAISDADDVEMPAGATVYDIGGRFVVPGLIDAHIHLREPSAGVVLFPTHGVTTVVNLEGEPSHLELRDSIEAQEAFAPRIVSSGPFLEEVASTPEEVRSAVASMDEAGYDLVKIHGEIEEDAYLAALDEAARRGLPVVAHHPDNLPTSVVLHARLTALAHAEEILGSSLLEEPVELSPDSVAAIARTIVESETAVITTLAFFTGMRDQATSSFYEMIQRPELAYLSPDRRHAWLYDGHREYIEPTELPWYERAVEALHRIVGAVHRQGGVVVAGTDTPLEFTIPGPSLHDELDRLVAAGLSPREAIRAATVVPADLIGRPTLGRIEVGASADLLVLDEDPRVSLDALERPHAVVLRGSWHSREEIELRLDRLAARYARAEVERAARARALDEIADLAMEEGVEMAVSEIRRLQAEPIGLVLGESEVNDLGYRLLGEEEVDAAIAVFRVNVESHPTSANAHDSLGEAYLAAGQLDRAEAAYRRALELDPTMDSARRGLEEIARRR